MLTEYSAFRSASIVLVTLLAIALLRGSVFGASPVSARACCSTPRRSARSAFTSLLLTVAGFWIGRYGETTARDRFHAPFLSVAVVTVLYAFGQILLQFVLGEPAPAGLVLHEPAARAAPQPVLTLPGLRARAAPLPAAAARRPRPRGAAPWLAQAIRPERFLPGDPRVEEPYRLTPQLAFRVAVIGFLALAVFAVLFLRLWALQVLSGDKYLARANDNRVRTLRLEAPRGPILDRNGHVLVSNVAGDAARALARRPAEDLAGRAARAARAVDGHGHPGQQDPRAAEPARLRSAHAGRRADRACTTTRSSTCRSTRASFPGVQLAESWLRQYPYQSLAAQVLGYVGQISPHEYKRLKHEGYHADDSIGQAGVEADLRHLPARPRRQAQLTVDSRGRPSEPVKPGRQPQAGDALRLTLDLGLQRAAEQALRYGIGRAHASLDEPYADGGAIVAMDPSDGSILAMASYPTYQPSVFVGRGPTPRSSRRCSNRGRRRRTTSRALNRAIQVGYPPGSTFKPVTALAAMQERLMHAERRASRARRRSRRYKQTFNNWTPLIDQAMNLRRARRVVRHLLLRARRALLQAAAEPRPSAAGAGRTGSASASRPASTSARRDRRADADARMALQDATPARQCYGDRPDLEAGLLDPARDRPGPAARDAAADGAPLRDDRERRQARDAAPRRGRRAEPAATGSRSACCGASAASRRRRPASTRRRSRIVQRGPRGGAHSPLGTSYGVFGSFPVAIAGKTGTAEKDVSAPGLPAPARS